MDPKSLCETVAARFPAAVMAAHTYRGDATVTLRRENLREVAAFLKGDPVFQMNFLMDLAGVDYLTFGKRPVAQGAFDPSGIVVKPPSHIPDETPWPGPPAPAGSSQVGPGPASARFEVVYHFFSLSLKHRLRVKVAVEESDPTVDSLVSLWASANWFEREVWDMYGIRFKGHPNLKRILLYEEFVGHPLRKDYPVNKRQPLIGPVN